MRPPVRASPSKKLSLGNRRCEKPPYLSSLKKKSIIGICTRYIFPPFISSISMPISAGYYFFNNQFRIQLHCYSFYTRRPSITQSYHSSSLPYLLLQFDIPPGSGYHPSSSPTAILFIALLFLQVLLRPWCGSVHLYGFFPFDDAFESPRCGFDLVCL